MHFLQSVQHLTSYQFGERAMQIEDVQNMTIRSLVRQNNLPGRPAFIISRVQLETLIDLGYEYLVLVTP